jgi:hypothetical protein
VKAPAGSAPPGAGAAHADGAGGIAIQSRCRNFIAAIDAISELPGIDPPQGRRDLLRPQAAAPFAFLGHGLLLHGIDPGEPADALLIEDDRGSRFAPILAETIQFLLIQQQTLTPMLYIHGSTIA